MKKLLQKYKTIYDKMKQQNASAGTALYPGELSADTLIEFGSMPVIVEREFEYVKPAGSNSSWRYGWKNLCL